MNWKRVIDRLFNSARSDAGIVEWSEIQRWPQGLFSALVNTDLLIPTLPAMNVQCTGCHRSCLMEVEHQMLNVSPRTLQSWRLRGGGPKFVKAGRAVRYRRRDLLDWIDKTTVENTSQSPNQ